MSEEDKPYRQSARGHSGDFRIFRKSQIVLRATFHLVVRPASLKWSLIVFFPDIEGLVLTQ